MFRRIAKIVLVLLAFVPALTVGAALKAISRGCDRVAGIPVLSPLWKMDLQHLFDGRPLKLGESRSVELYFCGRNFCVTTHTSDIAYASSDPFPPVPSTEHRTVAGISWEYWPDSAKHIPGFAILDDTVQVSISLWTLLCIVLIPPLWLIARVFARWYRQRRRRRMGLCVFCGYDKRAAPTGICPECGRSPDPST